MIRVWQDGESDPAKGWDVAWRTSPAYSPDLREVTTTFGASVLVDQRPGSSSTELAVKLAGPAGYLWQENSDGLTLRSYLKSRVLAKQTLLVFDDELARFYRGRVKIEDAPDEVTGGESFWDSPDKAELKLTLSQADGRGAYTLFGFPESIALPIVAADTTPHNFYVSGDYHLQFPLNQVFVVSGSSSGNNASYSAASAATYNSGTNRTAIHVATFPGTNGGGTLTRTNLSAEAFP